MRLDLHAGDLADLAFLRATRWTSRSATPHWPRSRTWAGCSARCSGSCARVRRSCSPSRIRSRSAPRRSRRPRDRCRSGARYLARSYFDSSPIDIGTDGEAQLVTRHPLGEVFTGLSRTGFRVDTLLEPEPAHEHGGRALLPAHGGVARPQRRFVTTHHYRAEAAWAGSTAVGYDRLQPRGTRCGARPRRGAALSLSGDPALPRRCASCSTRSSSCSRPRSRASCCPSSPSRPGARIDVLRLRGRGGSRHAAKTTPRCGSPRSGSARGSPSPTGTNPEKVQRLV